MHDATSGDAVRCTRLTKTFGAIRALDDLTLSIPRGSTFGLLGPNGAGKTTAMRLFLGLAKPTSGDAEVLGEPIPPGRLRSRIGYMPQDTAVYPDLTVEENLRLFGRLEGMDEAAIETRLVEVLGLVDILDRRTTIASNLSGGMRRRTSLATALLHDPDLLLLDEPTVGVDPELRASFWEFFGTLTRRGRTVVITTHYMEEAARCDRVALLHHGRLVADEAPARLKERTGAANLDDAFLALVRSGANPR